MYDQRQIKAIKNIKNAAIDYIFGLENGCLNNKKGSAEYQNYYDQIVDLESTIGIVYTEATTTYYSGNGLIDGSMRAKSILKDIRFCGKAFLMEQVRKYCMKYRQEVLDDLK